MMDAIKKGADLLELIKAEGSSGVINAPGVNISDLYELIITTRNWMVLGPFTHTIAMRFDKPNGTKVVQTAYKGLCMAIIFACCTRRQTFVTSCHHAKEPRLCESGEINQSDWR